LTEPSTGPDAAPAAAKAAGAFADSGRPRWEPYLVVFTLWLLVFSSASQTMILSPILPMIGDELRISDAVLGTLVSAYSFMVGIFAILSGPVSDKFGRRRILILGCGTMTVALALHGLVDSYGTHSGPDGTQATLGFGTCSTDHSFHSFRDDSSVIVGIIQLPLNLSTVRSRCHAEFASKRHVEQGGTGEAALFGDLGHAAPSRRQPVLGCFDMRSTNLLQNRAIEGAAEASFETLPTAPDGARHHRYGQALVRVLADPRHRLGDQAVVNGQHV
jgi:hypothetical protein